MYFKLSYYRANLAPNLNAFWLVLLMFVKLVKLYGEFLKSMLSKSLKIYKSYSTGMNNTVIDDTYRVNNIP